MRNLITASPRQTKVITKGLSNMNDPDQDSAMYTCALHTRTCNAYMYISLFSNYHCRVP